VSAIPIPWLGCVCPHQLRQKEKHGLRKALSRYFLNNGIETGFIRGFSLLLLIFLCQGCYYALAIVAINDSRSSSGNGGLNSPPDLSHRD
jgi:hypothetical protein